MSAIKDMVIAGCGITFLYETAVQKELRSGIIKKLDLSDCRIQHEISIVWKRIICSKTRSKNFLKIYSKLLTN